MTRILIFFALLIGLHYIPKPTTLKKQERNIRFNLEKRKRAICSCETCVKL